MPLPEKVQAFTAVQQEAFLGTISFKQKSLRGNTKPRYIVDLIKSKRRIQNKLRTLDTNTRIRGENMLNLCLQRPPVDQNPSMNDREYRYWLMNENHFKTEVRTLSKKINHELQKLKYKSWNRALENLAELDIDKAPREFYSTMKKLGGISNSNTSITCMEYLGRKESTEQGISDLMALHAADSFKPLDEPEFNYENFAKRERQWIEAQGALNMAQGKINLRDFNGSELLSPTYFSPYLRNQTLGEDAGWATRPNPTKHQTNTWLLKKSSQYKHKLDSLPPSPNPNLPVNDHWHEGLIHSSIQGEELLQKIYSRFTLDDLNRTIHKMKRKAPGNDQIFIDHFKYLGFRGKELLLEIANEIWEKGQIPDKWKEAIMVPILKKDKPARDPTSYRPISLLPVGMKIVESLVLHKLNSYLEERKLIPIVQTGFRKEHSTMINLKRMYTHAYSRSTRATHPEYTVMVFFDAKKAFDSVWHTGLLHKAMKDGLPGRVIRFLRAWLNNRQLRVRIGQTCSNTVQLDSGVPQGSVLAPLVWNYYTGDIPSTISSHSSTAVYADDTSTATSHRNLDTAVSLAQEEIWQLNDWTLKSRIKFEPKKTHILAIHKHPSKRNLIKSHTIYLDRNKQHPLQWTQHAKLLGVTFSDNGTFHKHINESARKCMARIKQLYKYAGSVKGDTLYKVYRAAIEPIALYGTEVIYENLTCLTLKKLISLEISAVKIAYQLEKRTSTVDCLHLLHKGGFVDRIDSRRTSFINKNADSPLIRQGETSVHSAGRRIRVKRIHIDRNSHKTSWKTTLKIHKPHIFFSDIGRSDTTRTHDPSVSRLMHPENFQEEAEDDDTPEIVGTRLNNQAFPVIRRFNIKPAYSRWQNFDPG